MTTEKQRGTFCGTVLYLDFGVGYMTVCVCVVSHLVMSDFATLQTVAHQVPLSMRL